MDRREMNGFSADSSGAAGSERRRTIGASGSLSATCGPMGPRVRPVRRMSGATVAAERHRNRRAGCHYAYRRFAGAWAWAAAALPTSASSGRRAERDGRGWLTIGRGEAAALVTPLGRLGANAGPPAASGATGRSWSSGRRAQSTRSVSTVGPGTSGGEVFSGQRSCPRLVVLVRVPTPPRSRSRTRSASVTMVDVRSAY
jgi:hypothetical protein